MAKECFCGCGRKVPFGRKRLTNMVGARVDIDLATFAGAAERGDHQHADELRALVSEGERVRGSLARVIHGELDRKALDRRAVKAWLARAGEQRKRLARDVAAADFAGWDALEQAELVHGGGRAPARIVEVEDTGTTINNSPRVRIRLRVEPEGEAPFELERKVTVSRVRIPREGEHVEVAYDPDDHQRFTFRMADLSDDAAAPREPTRLEQLERLGELRSAGVLTEAEFEREKARILASDAK